MKDGWHKICGREVYVKNNRVIRGTKPDGTGIPGNAVTAHPYRKCKTGGWDNCSGISVSTFRSLCNKGDLIMS